ncbi:MAG: diacylglycerol kinase family protein [Nocardioidaceae bacterium]
MTDSHAERRAALIVGSLLLPLAVLTALVAAGFAPLLSLDRDVVDSWHASVAGTGWQHFFDGVSAVGQPWVVRGVLLLVAAVALVARRNRRIALWIVVTLVANAALWNALKVVVQRSRPDIPHQIAGWSYPSGHASDIAAGMGLLLVITWQHVRRVWLRTALLVLWAATALLVGASRIFVGAHYPSDVVGGVLLGVVVVFVTSVLFGVVSTDDNPPKARPLSSLPEHRRTLAVVLNPTKLGEVDPFRARVGIAARAAGWDEPVWFETTPDDPGRSMTRAALAAGADVVAAAGGDGTVRAVCAEMAGTGVPVGVIPLGTGNLLARNLDIPLAEDIAIVTVLSGQDRAIDLVRIEGDGLAPTRFAVMAGMGLDAAIMDIAPDQLKKKMGWPAYFVAGITQLRYPAVKVAISIDGQEAVHRRARTVVIGNVGTLTAGIPLFPDARLDDGMLDVVVVAPHRFLGWVSLAWRVLTKRPHTDDRLDRFTGAQVVIKAATEIPRQLDGDTVGAGTELRAEVEAGVLLVRVPR